MADLLDFEWERARHGFEIAWPRPGDQGSRPAGGPQLRPRDDLRDHYRPLEERSALFMEFAEVPKTPEGVLEFADRYGLIESHFGPDCAFWYPHIDAVAHVVASWRHGAGKSFVEAWNALPLGICATRLVDRGRGAPPALAMVPASLLSAIYLQLGQTVANANDVTQCRWCATWFVHGTGTGRRRTALYCSDRCRKAAFRQEKG